MALPNIVYIIADQWRGDCLGVHGGTHPVMTPHLDQLADEGMRFARCHADCPVCMPARATLLTGQSGSRLGRVTNWNPPTPTPVDPATSLPGLLGRAGYHTRAVGKMHFVPKRARLGFDHIDLHPDDYVRFLEGTPWAGMFRGHGLGGNEVHPVVSPIPESHSATRWIVDRGIEFLQTREPDAPFFLWMIFEAPHSPFDPPADLLRLYDRMEPPPALRPDWCAPESIPPLLRRWQLMGSFDRIPPAVIAEARRAYYAQCTHIDYQLGRLLGELKDQGVYDNTIIVFTSDHGEHLGDYGLFGKRSFLHGSPHVPLIVRLPDRLRPQRGGVSETPALTADIVPTLLDCVEQPSPLPQDGRSLLPALRGEAPTPRIVCGECGGTAFAFDGRFKFIFYAGGGIEQFFDTVEDPHDTRPLDPAGHPDAARLRRALIDYLASHSRPMAAGGKLVPTAPPDLSGARTVNPCAWRGPMRWGDGY